MYCVDDHEKSWMLYGNEDSRYTEQDHSMMRLKVGLCNDESMVEGDPSCSSMEEIDEWLKNKKLVVKFLDRKIKYKDYNDENNFMRTEKIDTISLMHGFHTVDEHKFRRNEFIKRDSIWYVGEKTQIFFDYVFTTAKTFTTFDSHRLATVNFALAST